MFQGWKVFEKAGHGSSYDKYNSQMVVIVANSKKNRFLYIMPKVIGAIGNPERVLIMTRGSNVGLVKAEDDKGYKVQCYERQNRNGNKNTRHPYIQLTKFMDTYKLQPGAYNVHIENGMAIFDSADTPSTL